MRIIAGTLKGRRLSTPSWDGVRPTSDKLRETLFNILASRVQDASVLDGFAGTGAVGLEALSRGARHVTFVDADRRAAALVSQNVTRCGAEDRCAIIRASLRAALSRPLAGAPFDLIVLDPPYDEDVLADAASALAHVLAPGGLLVLEHASRRPAPGQAGRLVRVREHAAGDSALSFYRAAGPS